MKKRTSIGQDVELEFLCTVIRSVRWFATTENSLAVTQKVEQKITITTPLFYTLDTTQKNWVQVCTHVQTLISITAPKGKHSKYPPTDKRISKVYIYKVCVYVYVNILLYIYICHSSAINRNEVLIPVPTEQTLKYYVMKSDKKCFLLYGSVQMKYLDK